MAPLILKKVEKAAKNEKILVKDDRTAYRTDLFSTKIDLSIRVIKEPVVVPEISFRLNIELCEIKLGARPLCCGSHIICVTVIKR